jgi:3-hydroxyisobutyrate dehydrogenase-like beta-hydroxyacid dehydrogenase
MTRVAVVGLGAMGGRLASRLLDLGHDVVVWNRTRTRIRPLEARGASVARSPGAAAREVDVVVTMVSDPPALFAVLEGPDGLASGIRSPTTLIEMSTVGPAAIARSATLLPRGVGLLDAPVLGSLAEAEAGKLQIFVGGPTRLVRRWTPFLKAFGRPLHVGPRGSGAAAKLVANSTLFGVLVTLGEAMALAGGLGLSREATYAVLGTTPLSAQADRRREAIERGGFPPRYRLALARKDADLIEEAATAAGVDLRLAEAARSWLATAEQAGLAEQDYTAVLAMILRADVGEATPENLPGSGGFDRRGRGRATHRSPATAPRRRTRPRYGGPGDPNPPR